MLTTEKTYVLVLYFVISKKTGKTLLEESEIESPQKVAELENKKLQSYIDCSLIALCIILI